MQMEALGHSFFMFHNAESDQVNVIYLRQDRQLWAAPAGQLASIASSIPFKKMLLALDTPPQTAKAVFSRKTRNAELTCAEQR